MTLRYVVAPMLLLMTGWACAAETLTVTLHERAQVAGERLELDEIAEITGPTERAERLALLDIGPAPMPGQGRTLSLGYVKMRLRRWGLMTDDVVFDGAREVAVSTAPVTAPVTPQAPAPVAEEAVVGDEPAAPPPVVVRRNSAVRLQVTCGGVVIVAAATTLEDGTVGSIVKLRVTQTRQTTWARLDSPTKASLSR